MNQSPTATHTTGRRELASMSPTAVIGGEVVAVVGTILVAAALLQSRTVGGRIGAGAVVTSDGLAGGAVIGVLAWADDIERSAHGTCPRARNKGGLR